MRLFQFGLFQFGLLVLLLSYAPQVWALDLKLAEQRIFELTNQLRHQQNLPPLKALAPLSETARFHSRNMAQTGFFDHTDPQGRQPKDRLKQLYPGLAVATIGENIAYNSATSEEALAQKIYTQWKNSPGHYRNMVSQGYTHLGVGLSGDASKAYATQVFGAPLAYSEKALPTQIQQGFKSVVTMDFIGSFPKAELYLYLTVPNKTARFYTNKTTFYTGGGPLKIKWLGEQRFEIELPSAYGRGTYSLGIGRKKSFAPFHTYHVIPQK